MDHSSTIKRHNLAHMVRKHSEPYMRSNKKHDNDQGEVLLQMANDIMSNDSDMAALRLDALHYDIRSDLPFEVLDWLNKSEIALDN